jgi:stage III sporulation protein AF
MIMDIIRELVQNLIIIVVLAMFLEMFLPLGEMRRYVKMVMGLLIVVAVAQSVGNLLQRDFTLDIPSISARANDEQVAGIMESGRKISLEQQEKAIEQYKSGITNQVAAIAGMNQEFPIAAVEVTLSEADVGLYFGQIKQIRVYLENTSPVPVIAPTGRWLSETVNEPDGNEVSPEVAQRISRIVAGFYNLTPEQVLCTLR